MAKVMRIASVTAHRLTLIRFLRQRSQACFTAFRLGTSMFNVIVQNAWHVVGCWKLNNGTDGWPELLPGFVICQLR
jgi:hypothetical protein